MFRSQNHLPCDTLFLCKIVMELHSSFHFWVDSHSVKLFEQCSFAQIFARFFILVAMPTANVLAFAFFISGCQDK